MKEGRKMRLQIISNYILYKYIINIIYLYNNSTPIIGGAYCHKFTCHKVTFLVNQNQYDVNFFRKRQLFVRLFVPITTE